MISKEDEKVLVNNRYMAYAGFIQASITFEELFSLFYNGLLYDKAHTLLDEFQILENLPIENLIDKSHQEFYPNTKFKLSKYNN